MYSFSYHLGWQKRTFDITVSLFLIIFLLPIFGIVLLSILVTSGFPAFFLQTRQGQHKKTFKMLKFRTMRIHAKTMKDKLQQYNEAPFPMFKMQNDPRFTKIGKLLSKTGIDEIPQLFHVLMGQMSIVGPRPLPIEEAEKLPKSWDFRYKVRPGILSDWAVAPDRYHSLKRWKALESQGLERSSLKEELQLITNGLRFLMKSNIAFLLRRRKEPIKVNARRTRPVIQRQASQLSS